MSGSLPGIGFTWSGPLVRSGRLPARPWFDRPSPPPSRGGLPSRKAPSLRSSAYRSGTRPAIHTSAAGYAPGGKLRCAPLPRQPLAGGLRCIIGSRGWCSLAESVARPRAHPARRRARLAPRYPPLRYCLARVPRPRGCSSALALLGTPART